MKKHDIWILLSCINRKTACWCIGAACLLLILLFAASPQILYATEEPSPTPVIEAPPAPPLAITPPEGEAAEVEEEGRPLFLLILIVIVASGTALSVGFYTYRKVRQFLANRKKKKAAKQADK